METLNIHLPNLYHLGLRIVKEMQDSQTANSSSIHPADTIRLGSFFSAFRANLAMIGVPGTLDLPESDPIPYPLRALPELKDLESQAMNQLSLLMRTLLVEMTRSQSSRNSSGVSAPDRRRWLAIVDESERHLSEALKIQPLDLVESSPRAPLQGAGLNTLGNK